MQCLKWDQLPASVVHSSALLLGNLENRSCHFCPSCWSQCLRMVVYYGFWKYWFERLKKGCWGALGILELSLCVWANVGPRGAMLFLMLLSCFCFRMLTFNAWVGRFIPQPDYASSSTRWSVSFKHVTHSLQPDDASSSARWFILFQPEELWILNTIQSEAFWISRISN